MKKRSNDQIGGFAPENEALAKPERAFGCSTSSKDASRVLKNTLRQKKPVRSAESQASPKPHFHGLS
jgi:hypothetical protein